MSVKMSICIMVYNQIELVKKNLSNLIQYDDDNIEIIVQDDCSSDNIEGLVLSFNDKRIKYFRNETNIGLDDNILEAFKNCNSKWIFLLRSSDTLIVKEIQHIIEYIDKHDNSGYVRFSCVDEDGIKRIEYPDKDYLAGEDSVKAHENLLSHPSGELYNIKYFNDYDNIVFKGYLNQYFNNNRKFVIDMLMRYKLMFLGGISTSSLLAWQYVHTVKRKDVAMNSAKNGMCVYHPTLMYPRYHCELSYVSNELKYDGQLSLIDEVINRYAKNIIYNFKYINKDKAMQLHYNFREIKFSPYKELNEFKKNTKDFAQNYDNEVRNHIICKIEKYSLITLIYWETERLISAVLSKSNSIISSLKKRHG